MCRVPPECREASVIVIVVFVVSVMGIAGIAVALDNGSVAQSIRASLNSFFHVNNLSN